MKRFVAPLGDWAGRSIANRMAITAALLAFAFVLATGAASYLEVRHSVAEGARSELRAEARLVLDRLQSTLQAAQSDVSALAGTSLVVNALLDVRNRAVYLEPFLRQGTVPVRVPYHLHLTDHLGRSVASSTSSAESFYGRPWFSRLMGEGRPAVEVTGGDAPTLVLAFPVVPASDGLAEGILVFELPLGPLVEQAAASFTSQGHRVRVRHGPRQLGDVVPEGYDAREGALVEVVGVPPQPLLLPEGLEVQLEVPTTVALATLPPLAAKFAFGGLMAFLLVGALTWLAARQLVAPLRTLSLAAEAAQGAGSGPVRFELEGQDERAQLARSLQRMVDGLQGARETLEARVAERTAELHFAESRMRATLDHMIDGLITVDEGGRVESFNPSAERLFGWTAAEVVGRSVTMLMGEPHASRHDGYVRAYLKGGPPRVIGVGRVLEGRRRDGSTFPLDISLSDVRFQGRHLFVGLVRDATDRLRAERVKDEFVSTVSHELRTPLTAIRGALGLLAGGLAGPLTEPSARLVGVAKENGERLTRLIDDLLDIQKIEAGALSFQLVPAPLPVLLRESVRLNLAFAERYKVGLSLLGEPPGLEVMVDAGRFQQVMSNLVSNAVKFAPAGSAVELSAARCPGERVRIEVRDRGPGIPEEFQRRIFQRFAQADSSSGRIRGGTGLGLAISKALVDRMGGEIGFRSVPGQGTTFHFVLPILPQAPLPAEVAADAADPAVGKEG